jgi:hypothetical protein
MGRSASERMARARELGSLRQIALAWFLNQYLVDKEEEEGNASYGGFGAMAKAGDYEALNIRETAPLTYSFDFEQLVAGRTDLMTRLPTPDPPAHRPRGPSRSRWGCPPTPRWARLETNSEWYRLGALGWPWDGWTPRRSLRHSGAI